MIYVADRPDVDVRLVSLKFLLSHPIDSPPDEASRNPTQPPDAKKGDAPPAGVYLPESGRRLEVQQNVEPTMGIEPMAYALPRRCSASELRGHANGMDWLL